MSDQDEKVFSFEEFRRRKLGAHYKRDLFSAEFEKGLSEQSELLDWYIFNRHFNKYRLFLHSLLKDNEVRKENPSAGFVLAYSESDLEHKVSELGIAAQRAKKTYLPLMFGGKSFMDACMEITHGRATTNHDAIDAIRQQLLETEKIVIIAGLSQSSIRLSKGGLAKDLFKTVDDAWIHHGFIPRSCLIFVDYPLFLQQASEDIEQCLDVLG